MSCGLTESDVGKPTGVGEGFRRLLGGKPCARLVAYEFRYPFPGNGTFDGLHMSAVYGGNLLDAVEFSGRR